ncbi:MAG: macrolide ABC transporter ATP-binding protein [Chloroflexi bacterium]|nr:macrolide ABC transporter ATP-binding protein [Chloroflexota bacterium]|tara:strand:+ start:82 stop:783 length:702 start_codon:yes stop_codon:yes gene_type:complete
MDLSNSLIHLRQVKKLYSIGEIEVAALDGVDLEIQSGEFISITGPSGSGKSTLMNMLGCLDVPTTGEFYLDGNDVSKLSDGGLAKIRNQMIGFVFQTYNLLPKLTALQNVELPLVYGNVSRRKENALNALELVGLGDRVKHLPTELSGGQQQRVGIARALATNPSILLADEPTGNLDSSSTEEIMRLIEELNQTQNITVVLVTHENEIAERAKRSVHIVDGKIVNDVLIEAGT